MFLDHSDCNSHSTGSLEPVVPDWVFSPDEDAGRFLTAGHAWPPLRRLLDSAIGAAINLDDLGFAIAQGLTDSYQSEIESQDTKFRRVSGFDVLVSRDGTISMRDRGTGRPLDTNFHVISDKHRLFVTLNEAVRHFVGEPLNIPLVLRGGRSWMASSWRANGEARIGQKVTC